MLISGTAFDYLKNKVTARFEDRGNQTLAQWLSGPLLLRPVRHPETFVTPSVTDSETEWRLGMAPFECGDGRDW